MERLLLLLSAVVEGNMLLNCQPESVNVVSIFILVLLLSFSLPSFSFIYSSDVPIQTHSMRMNEKASSFLLHDQLPILPII